MRIVSWNIRQGGGSRSPQIASQLAAWNPDIVGLCEFGDTEPSRNIAESLKNSGRCYQHSTVSSDNSVADRLLLASRWPIYTRPASGVLATTERWIDARITGPREIGIALMWVPDKRRDEHAKYEFQDAAIEVLKSLADTAGIAIGDTNTGAPDIDVL